MEGKVLLFDSKGTKIGETFARRARQLVKQQRAFWIDDKHESIRFYLDTENMDTAERDMGLAPQSFTFSEPSPSADKKIMKLARRRVILGSVYKMICLIYLAVCTFLVVIWFTLTGRGDFWPAWVIMGWGIAIVILGIVFKVLVLPLLTLDDRVANEYSRLKNLHSTDL